VFSSSLGVTAYLTQEAIRDTLATFRLAGSGSPTYRLKNTGRLPARSARTSEHRCASSEIRRSRSSWLPRSRKKLLNEARFDGTKTSERKRSTIDTTSRASTTSASRWRTRLVPTQPGSPPRRAQVCSFGARVRKR